MSRGIGTWLAWGVVVVVIAGLMSGDAYSGPGGAGPSVDVSRLMIVGDLEQFDSLKALLSDAEIIDVLDPLLRPLALWSIATTAVPALPEESCLPLPPLSPDPAKFRHRLEFATRDQPSTRVYVVEFLSCKLAPGDYSFTVDRSGFETNRDLPDSTMPVLRGPSQLSIFRQAFNDAVVGAAIRGYANDQPLKLSLLYDAKRSDVDNNWFALAVTDAESDADLFEVGVLYDLLTDSASFEDDG